MKYGELQRRLKSYQGAGLVTVPLNSTQSILEVEYQRCLQLNLSQDELEQLTAIKNFVYLDLISCLEIQAHPEKFPIRVIKAKAFALGQVATLVELKSAFPIFQQKSYDFRTKIAWSQCTVAINNLTQNTQDFDKFKQDVESFILAMAQGRYHSLTGDVAITEAYDDLSNYISWWKGAQWEYTLATKASTIDLLKRAWLEQYLTQHNLSQLLNYSPID